MASGSELHFGRVLVDRRDVGIFGFHELMVVVYRGRIEVDVLQAVRASQRQLHAEHGAIAGLTILSPQSLERPDGGVRLAGQSISDEFDGIAYASSIVLDESGLRGAFIRSILTGIRLASRRSLPQRVFGDVGSALRWLAQQRPEGPLAARTSEVEARIRFLTKTFDQVTQWEETKGSPP